MFAAKISSPKTSLTRKNSGMNIQQIKIGPGNLLLVYNKKTKRYIPLKSFIHRWSKNLSTIDGKVLETISYHLYQKKCWLHTLFQRKASSDPSIMSSLIHQYHLAFFMETSLSYSKTKLYVFQTFREKLFGHLRITCHAIHTSV